MLANWPSRCIAVFTTIFAVTFSSSASHPMWLLALLLILLFSLVISDLVVSPMFIYDALCLVVLCCCFSVCLMFGASPLHCAVHLSTVIPSYTVTPPSHVACCFLIVALSLGPFGPTLPNSLNRVFTLHRYVGAGGDEPLSMGLSL